LLDAGHQVTYRPHPRTGASDYRVRQEDLRLRELLSAAAKGRVDDDRSLTAAMADADALITDVSSVAVEWLPSGKPLLVTRRDDPALRVTASPLLALVPRLDEADAGRAAEVLAHTLADESAAEQRRALVRYYLGDVTPGAATRAFIAACTDALALRNQEQARLAALPEPAAIS
jgi:CDP-glycerol glycerophosphotransferase (TagB/SpsB family)